MKLIKITFRESLLIHNLLFEAGETITVIYLGGGCTLRIEWEGKRLEFDSRLVRQEILK